MNSTLTNTAYVALQRRAVAVDYRLSTADHGATFQLARATGDGPVNFFELDSAAVVIAALEDTSPTVAAFPRTERRDMLADVLRAHYDGAVTISDDPFEWLPGAGHAGERVGLTGTEYAATAKRIAQVTDCTIGDAAGQLDLIGTVLEVTR